MSRLLEFKAGKCERRGETAFVDPLPGRGLIFLEQQDGLLHFCYKDLTTSIVDDLIVFPGDASFTPTSRARVYVLQFSSSDARHFFWMQDVSSEKDEQNVRRVNALIEDPEQEFVDVEMADQPPAYAAGSSSQQQSSDETRGDVPFTSDQLSRLQHILASARGTSAASAAPSLLLSDVLAPPLSLNESIVESLYSFLPPSLPSTSENVRRILESSELKRAIRGLDMAFINAPGALAPMCEGLGLGGESALSAQTFVEAVKKQAEEGMEGRARMETD
ncbi:adhesion regulating molecule [Atractiella rhizophila]|nr:adhesion regulating molecule [Atractiella rhizophila]